MLEKCKFEKKKKIHRTKRTGKYIHKTIQVNKSISIFVNKKGIPKGGA